MWSYLVKIYHVIQIKINEFVKENDRMIIKVPTKRI